jgi:Trypsin.
MKKLFLLVSLVVLVAIAGQAQKEVVGIPYSFIHNDISLAVDRVDFPAYDLNELLAEDAQKMKDGSPLRIGAVRHVSYNFNNSGRTDILPDGSRLWRLTLHSPDALAMAVFFSTYNIPEGATMHVYSGDRKQLTGTYTAEDIEPNGVMASEFIEGDELTIEYHEPADVLYHGVIEIDRVSHIYRDVWLTGDPEKGSVDDAGDCHYHAVCPEGAAWRNQINSVVRISITGESGTYFCSGALINNVRMDKTPYVLSANHCLDGASSSFRFDFFYQFKNCNGTGNDIVKYLNGGEIKAFISYNSQTGTSTSSDFLLLLITKDLASKPWSDSLYFSGWDASGAASVGLAIHHPAGARKRFSFPRQVSSYGNKYWETKWYTNPNRGCTEQGSSGSPLFNANKLIIGDLSSGSSDCDYPQGSDYYGKLSYSWTNNNNSSNNKKLKPWLDPDNTGVLTLPGMDFHGQVGVRDNSSHIQYFNVSPNPTAGNVVVRGSFKETTGRCDIYNAMGMLVYSEQLSLSPSFNLNLDDLTNGIYFVEINDGSQLFRSKVVIAK